MNACLAPLCSVDGMMVTTIEGLGNVRDGLHPVQVHYRIKELKLFTHTNEHTQNCHINEFFHLINLIIHSIHKIKVQ